MCAARRGGQARPLTSPIALILVALAVRAGALVLSPRALEDDPDGYRAVAENLLEHGTFGTGDVPTAYRPPLYPLVLAPCLALDPGGRTAIGLLHVVFGVATVGLTFRLAERWGLGRWAWLAGLLVAVDPILLRQSTLVMTETLAALLAAAALGLLTAAGRRPTAVGASAAGACIALAALCRPTFLPWLAVAAVALPWSASRAHGMQPGRVAKAHGLQRRGVAKAHGMQPVGFKSLVAFIGGAAVVLSPWVIRNEVQFGRPIVSTTHGGYTFWLANNPDFYGHLRTGAWGTLWDAEEFNRAWLAEAPRDTPAEELAADRLAYGKAWEAIRHEPGMFACACVVRLGRFWSPLPRQVNPLEGEATRLARYAVGVWYGGELLLAGLGLWFVTRRRTLAEQTSEVQTSEVTSPLGLRPSLRLGWVWGILLIACFMGVHCLYWTDMRMRGPVESVVALAAAAGGRWLAGRAVSRK